MSALPAEDLDEDDALLYVWERPVNRRSIQGFVAGFFLTNMWQAFAQTLQQIAKTGRYSKGWDLGKLDERRINNFEHIAPGSPLRELNASSV